MAREPNAGRDCTVPGCRNVHRARGYCNTHHKRWLRHGDPLTVGTSGRKPGGLPPAHEQIAELLKGGAERTTREIQQATGRKHRAVEQGLHWLRDRAYVAQRIEVVKGWQGGRVAYWRWIDG